MKIEIFISYHSHGVTSAKKKFYGLHIHIDGKPAWTTYISPEDYETLKNFGIQQI